ncbi:hypothetical protein O3M35_012150 [Rhynocoris fuscipes]|uniref:Non-specific protein-tyrosine kinase n=1 Tax=Rhynocoris fuscipes TaxID=488301 RepID=A0AAW1CX65_9HEMI
MPRRNDGYYSMTCKELKAELGAMGLSRTGLKADLVGRLESVRGPSGGGGASYSYSSYSPTRSYAPIRSSSSDLNKMTCVQLKEELGQRGLKKSGLKADLVERLASATQSQSSCSAYSPTRSYAPIRSSSSDLNQMTCVQLKEELGQRGLKKSGLKADLVERLDSAIQAESYKPSPSVKHGNTTSHLADNLNTLTCVQLKEELGERGLKKSGLKAELVDRLESAISNELGLKNERHTVKKESIAATQLPGDLIDLTCVQLKEELGARGLKKSGLKADLVERLESALADESLGNISQKNLNKSLKTGIAASKLPENLYDLTCEELKEELGIRGLKKSGLKADLVERLESALIDEGSKGRRDNSQNKQSKRYEPLPILPENLATLTCKQLKEELAVRGLKRSGLKAELIDRLQYALTGTKSYKDTDYDQQETGDTYDLLNPTPYQFEIPLPIAPVQQSASSAPDKVVTDEQLKQEMFNLMLKTINERAKKENLSSSEVKALLEQYVEALLDGKELPAATELISKPSEQLPTKSESTNAAAAAESATVSENNDDCEINPKELVISEILGEGSFAVVKRGEWNGIPVAVKYMKIGPMSVEDFEREAKVMKALRHGNVVQLYGVWLKKHPMYIVTEFMEHGTLLKYLRSQKAILIKDTQRLTDMCYQIASGMAYLEQRNLIHRDLAARNCLVGKGDVVKLGDFGLSRCVDTGMYSGHNLTVFAVKWAAPEVILRKKFSLKSDVWAYGVVMWEIFTCGETPYGELDDASVLNKVMNRELLERPSICPDVIYNVMLKCWSEIPEDRPSFIDLKQK